MSILKSKLGSTFVDVCNIDYRVRKGASWFKVKPNDYVFANGSWRQIICALPFKWVIDPSGSSCEKTDLISDIPFTLNNPFSTTFPEINLAFAPGFSPVLKKNNITGHYLFNIQWIELNSAGVGPGVYNEGFSPTTNPGNAYRLKPIAQITNAEDYPPADIIFTGVGCFGKVLNGKIGTNGNIWILNAEERAITAWNPADPIYKMHSYFVDYEGEFGGLNVQINTGNDINTLEAKVTDDVSEFPLDNNNQLVSISGQPQSTRSINIGDANYITVSTTCIAAQTQIGNEVQSADFTKSCSGGFVGDVVTYTVPANKYYAATQETANDAALAEISANGQENANILGSCTEIPVTPCGSSASYSGGESYPTEQIIELGASTGLVVFNFDALTVPDKFIVEFDGVEVINTGYRGDPANQAALDAALASKGLPPETIVGMGAGSLSFNKITTTTTALVKVFAPIAGTAWSFTMECPAVISDDIDFYYTTSWGDSPYQEASYDIEKNDVLIIQQTPQETTNDFNGVFVKGDKIKVIHTTLPANYPWETLSGSRLRLVKNGTIELFNNKISAQANPLQNFVINTDYTFNRIDMYITGESTKTGIITNILRPYIFLNATGVFELKIIDNTDSSLKLNIIPTAGGDKFKFNRIDDGNTVILAVKNTSGSSKNIYVEGGSGFSFASAVAAGATLNVTGIPKGSGADVYFFDVAEIGFIRKGDFTRNNCSGSLTGGTIRFVKGYVDEAASTADTGFNAEGQARANSIGECT